MQNLSKKRNFSIFYIIFTSADFTYSIFNLIRHFFYSEFSIPDLFSSLGNIIFSLLPLFAFILLSKKAEEIDDLEKRIKVKKIVIFYISACFFLGVIDSILSNIFYVHLPKFIFRIFYSANWLFNISYIIRYHMYNLIISLSFEICLTVISIFFINSLGKEKTTEKEFEDETGSISTGYKLGIVSIVLLSIQTIVNIIIAVIMHKNMQDTGEHAIGTAFVAIILIALKLLLDLIFLPAIPISIAGIIKSNSKNEINQARKNRLLGKKINIICLLISVAELVLIW